MGWRKILESEDRLVMEVLEAAESECAHIEATGIVRTDLVADMLGFFRYFCEGLHGSKLEQLLYARCRKRGMSDEDEPLEQMVCDHSWCQVSLGKLKTMFRDLPPNDGAAALALAGQLREHTRLVRWHIDVERAMFYDLVQHYLNENDRRELSEEFEAVHEDEVNEGVLPYWEELAHNLLAQERHVVL
jgi:hemerythrin-like domain-containing protein